RSPGISVERSRAARVGLPRRSRAWENRVDGDTLDRAAARPAGPTADRDPVPHPAGHRPRADLGYGAGAPRRRLGSGGVAAARRTRRRRTDRARRRREDRRRVALMLSPGGERAFRGAEALLSKRLGSLLAQVPRPEMDALARVLPRVETALSGAPPPPPPPPPAP